MTYAPGVLIPADEPCPLPEDPALAEAALAFEAIGQWAYLLDHEWNVVYYTRDQRLSFGLGVQLVPIEINVNLFSTASMETSIAWPVGPGEIGFFGDWLRTAGPMMLADHEGRRADLEQRLDPRIVDQLEGMEAAAAEVASITSGAIGSLDRPTSIQGSISRIRDRTGRCRGIAMQWKPAVPMTTLGGMAYDKDLGHLERVQAIAAATRQPAAILFGDLEGSSALAKTMSTAGYFNLVRRIVRTTDQAIVDQGGIVGRHVGDGVVAFFPVAATGSESAAARAAVEAARTIQTEMTTVADRSGVDAEAVVVRFGLHWGASVFMGNISTAARSEVTALGDEVNESARIEACATGGRILASKPLVERLTSDDGAAIGLDPERIGYTQLADLSTTTEKARRDAPAIAVCEL
jgi:class 3 adenylate cyclase